MDENIAYKNFSKLPQKVEHIWKAVTEILLQYTKQTLPFYFLGENIA